MSTTRPLDRVRTPPWAHHRSEPDAGPVASADTAVTAQARRPHEWWALVGFVVVAQCAGLVGLPFTDRVAGGWYDSLDKPPFNPPNWVFGPVWTTLYLLIGVAAWRVWRTPDAPLRRRALIAWAVQLGLNAAWTPIFFGAEQLGLALFELSALVLAVFVAVDLFRQRERLAAGLMVPYLLWVCFATVLNASLLALNFD